MKKEKVEKKIVSKKKIKLDYLGIKEYDNEHIQIRARDNDMPQLYGKNIDKMEFKWSSKYPTQHCYEYTFEFADRKEA